MSRCTGHCCVEFPLPHSLNELQDGRDFFKDGNTIADMVVFKGTGHYADGQRAYYYSCIHFDKKTRDCKAYDTRPKMCSEYPYGAPCEHKDCTEGSKPDVTLSRLRQSAVRVSPKYNMGR